MKIKPSISFLATFQLWEEKKGTLFKFSFENEIVKRQVIIYVHKCAFTFLLLSVKFLQNPYNFHLCLLSSFLASVWMNITLFCICLIEWVEGHWQVSSMDPCPFLLASLQGNGSKQQS